MDADAFRDAVEGETATELDRLGSGNLLVALTGAELDPDTVLAVAAARERSVAGVLDAWAEDESDERAREAFADRAAVHRRRADGLLDRTEDAVPADRDDPVAAHLAGLDGTAERAAGAAGRALVDERAYTQFVSFFVNEADRDATDAFRSYKEDAGDAVEQWTSLLETLDATGDDRPDAPGVAAEVIQVAYDDYADSLRELGLDPKPVC